MRNPYYIMAPSYTATSGGVEVLYHLCSKLNSMGFEAYIANSKSTTSKLNAPILNDSVVSRHVDFGLNPIAVYPEIYSGNPLNCNACVRYMLNKQGVINGNNLNASDDDLYFYYVEPFMEGINVDGNKLEILIIDLELFSPDRNRDRFRNILYINRYPIDMVDFDQLPEDVEVLSMDNPVSHEDLAKMFKEAKALYSYEYSTTCTMAMLCGCPLVVKGFNSGHNYGFTSSIISVYEGLGYSFFDDSDSLSSAQASLIRFREKWIKKENESKAELNRFVEITQKKAQESRDKFIGISPSPLALWREARKPTDYQKTLLLDRVDKEEVIGFVFVDRGLSECDIFRFYQSFKVIEKDIESLEFILLTDKSSIKGKVGGYFFDLDNNNVAGSIKSALEAVDVSWFVVVDSPVTLSYYSFLAFILELDNAPVSCSMVYGDELTGGGSGISGAIFHPDFNLDLLLSQPYVMCRRWFYRKSVFLELGGFDESLEFAFELDFILRTLENRGFSAFGHVHEPIFVCPQEIENFPRVEEKRVILQHLKRRGYDSAIVTEGGFPGTFNISYNPDGLPFASVLVLANNRLPKLQACVESILEKTSYSNYELLIVEGKSSSPEKVEWFDGVDRLGIASVRVLRNVDAEGDLSALNQAMVSAKGEYAVIVNDDLAVLGNDWLTELLNHAQRPEVGLACSKTLSSQGRVESGCLIAGLNGVAGSSFVNSDVAAPGYLNRLQVDQNCSVVSPDCFAISRERFFQLGGFDDSLDYPYAGVDLALRAVRSGNLNVWTPRSLLMRMPETKAGEVEGGHRSLAPNTIESEAVFYERWLPQLVNDPSYNRNFTLTGYGFEVEQRIDLTWQPHKLLGQSTILVCPADQWGCGHYRIIQPMEAMKAQGVAGGMVAWEWLTIPEMAKLEPDACVFQRQITDEAVANMKRARNILKKPVVYELDDYLPNLPLKSAYRKNMPKDILKSLRRSLKHVDRFVVSTHPLAEAFKGIHSDIRVVENCLPVDWWESVASKRLQSEKPRVGWAGGRGHTGDLELVEAVIRDLAEEVEWVFFGMCPDRLRPYVKEVHEGVDIAFYPKKLASMNLDLAIAPLEDNLFNRCKSNLRLLEYGACGFPVVCSDVEPYREHGLPVTRVKNRYKDWIDAIRMHLGDLNESARQGDELKRIVRRDWMLKGENLHQWLDAWTKF